MGNGGGEGVHMGKERSDLIAIYQRILIRIDIGFGRVRVLHDDEDDEWAPSAVREGVRWAGCWAVTSCARGG